MGDADCKKVAIAADQKESNRTMLLGRRHSLAKRLMKKAHRIIK
jgi:hypothetical protein